MTPSPRPVWLAIAGLVGLALAAFGYLFLRYSRTAALAGMGASSIQVAIVSPAAGSSSAAGAPVLVKAAVASAEPIAELELWANGELVALSGAPAIDQPGLLEEFLWIPTGSGKSQLVARAINDRGRSAVSPPIVAFVDPTGGPMSDPLLDGAAGGGPSPLVADRAGGAGFPPPDDDLAAHEDVPESMPASRPGLIESDELQVWKPGLALFLAFLLPGESPDGGDGHLQATVEGCSVRLDFYDSASGELGFIIKRSTPDVPDVHTIASIMPHSGMGWWTFEDASAPIGTHLYHIVTFDEVGSYLSNFAVAQLGPEDCPPQGIANTLVTLRLLETASRSPAEQVYCYVTAGGGQWFRWPSVGFLGARSGVAFASPSEQLLAYVTFDVEPTLDLECWEWRDGNLALVGTIHRDEEAILAGETALSSNGGLSLELAQSSEAALESVGSLTPQFPLHMQIPLVQAAVSYDPDVCKAHLPPDAQNLLGQLLFCTPFPMYEVGEQPYLIWYVNEGQCAAGIGCLSVQQLVDMAKSQGAQVGFHVYGSINPSWPAISTPIDFSTYVVPPYDPYYCGAQRSYSVRMYYQGDPVGSDVPYQTALGAQSQWVSIPFNCPPPSGVELEVRFTHAHFGDLDDNDNGPEVLEVYGTFYAFASNGAGGYLNMSEWGAPYGDCTQFDSLTPLLDALCPQFIGQYYDYDLDFYMPWPLCDSSTPTSCTGSWGSPPTIRLYVDAGEAIKAGVILVDYDEASANDEACVVEVWTEPYSGEVWASMDQAPFWMYQGDNGNASCEVYWTVTATGVYY